MDRKTLDKISRLKSRLAQEDGVLVAFSGGVDSSLLLALAREALPGRVFALTVQSILNPPQELEAAKQTAQMLDVRHVIVDFDALALDAVKNNTRDRCYHCKAALAKLFLEQAADLGLAAVVEGSNADDARLHRPGARALEEAGIKSPLKEAGLSKAEIRAMARDLGLPTWDRPSAACLATRFPYDTALEREYLVRVYAAERFLARHGLAGTRARLHHDILRLEAPGDGFDRFLDPDFREKLVHHLTGLGFRYVTLDLGGYRSGVFDTPGNKG